MAATGTRLQRYPTGMRSGAPGEIAREVSAGKPPPLAPNEKLAVIGKPIDEEVARAAGRAALRGAVPLTQNAYKLQIFETLVRRAILAANGSA